MSNPYESPKSSSEPNGSPPVALRTVGMSVAGFLVALLMAIAVGIPVGLASVLLDGPPSPLGSLLRFLCGPMSISVTCSIILWSSARVRNRPFALGAAAFGIAVFLLVGRSYLVFSE